MLNYFGTATKTIRQCISVNTCRVKGLKGLWCKSNVFIESDFETTNIKAELCCTCCLSWKVVAFFVRSLWHYRFGMLFMQLADQVRLPHSQGRWSSATSVCWMASWKTGTKFCRCQAEACALRYFCAILVEAVVNKLLCLLSYCWTYAPSFHVSSRQFKGPWGIATKVFRTVLETL